MSKSEEEPRNHKYLLKDKVTLLSVEKIKYFICSPCKYKAIMLPKLECSWDNLKHVVYSFTIILREGGVEGLKAKKAKPETQSILH